MLGDLIQVKRYENRLTRGQLAIKVGIAAATVRAWEHDVDRPDEHQMRQMAEILDLRAIDPTQ